MPATSSSPFITSALEQADKGRVGDNVEDITPRPMPSIPSMRSWTSLQEHADAVRAATLGGVGEEYTPRSDDRREGFTWAAPQGEDQIDKPRRRGHSLKPYSPPLTKILHDSQDNAPARSRTESGASTNSSDTSRHLPHNKRTSTTSSSIGLGISRHDTGRSSFGSIARGVMRHVPDINMFAPDEKKTRRAEKHVPGDVAQRPNEPDGTLTPKRTGIDEKVYKHVHILDGPKPKSSRPAPLKGGLKDRRNLDQVEAMKLTLPLELPDLPARRRMSAARILNIRDIAPPRPRSPKTPWIRETAPSWDPVTNSPPILERPPPFSVPEPKKNEHGLLPGSDLLQSSVPLRFNERPIRIRKYINRSRKKRDESQASESSIASHGAFAPEKIQTAPLNEPPLKPLEGLDSLSKTSRRWRWSGPWNWSEASSRDSPPYDVTDRRCSFSNPFHTKRRSYNSPPPVSPFTQPAQSKITGHHTQDGPHTYGNALAIANMPVPPIFVPPGLRRIDTPPIFDQAGEVKGKLADFVFEMQDIYRRRPLPGVPGSVWDSDTLLMSQNSNITPKSSPSDESPTKPTPSSLTDNKESWPGPLPTPNSILLSPPVRTFSSALAQQSTTPTANRPDWFRIPRVAYSDPNFRAVERAEERAKFEWLTPEHLPNSPLCPLSVKYRGPSKGMCVFHGRSDESGTQALSVDGESPGWKGDVIEWGEGLLALKTSRRSKWLASLSTP